MIEDMENTNTSINNFYEKFEDIQMQKLDLQDEYDEMKTESNKGTTV
jgi:hypothetical protein